MKKKNIIECRDITKTYINGDNKTTVLKGISFTIEEGEYVAICGPSGSGKSTLMHIIGALDVPTTGQFVLGGRDVSKMSDDALADIRNQKIGFVFQAFNLLARSSVRRNVGLPLIYGNVPEEKREQLIKDALCGAQIDPKLFDNLSNQLSGGQMRRVAIARALVNNPDVILADEPTGNLDQKTGKAVLEAFAGLHAQGKTIVLITHDVYVAQQASRTIQIRDGEIVSDTINRR